VKTATPNPFEAAAAVCLNPPFSVVPSYEDSGTSSPQTPVLHCGTTENGAFAEPNPALVASVAPAFGLPCNEAALDPDSWGLGAWEATGGTCPLPGHDGTAHLTIGLAKGRGRYGRELRFECNCLGCESHWAWKGDTSISDYDRHLGDAYRALVTGRELEHGDTLPNGERAYWLNRLGHDIGIIEPVALPELPADADDLTRRARDHFALFSARRNHETGSPIVAWAVGLVATDLGITKRQAHNAIRSLIAAGVIEFDHKDPDRVGEKGVRYGVHYYRPGLVSSSPAPTVICDSSPAAQEADLEHQHHDPDGRSIDQDRPGGSRPPSSGDHPRPAP
jgi:hypothetical protein